MQRLLSIEWMKNRRSRAFWILLGVYIVFMSLHVASARNFIENLEINGVEVGEVTIFYFPEIWQYLTFFARFYNVLLAILVITNVCSEYSYRTLRQHLIDGLSRQEFIGTKFIFLLLLSLLGTLFVGAVGLGFGFAYTPAENEISPFTDAYLVPVYFLQTLAFLTLALFAGLWIKRTGPAILVFLGYAFLLEPLLHYVFKEFKFIFPLEAIGQMITNPFEALFEQKEPEGIISARGIGIGLIYLVVSLAGSYTLLQRRDQ